MSGRRTENVICKSARREIDMGSPIILYEYQMTRKADHLREFLKGFTVVVVCDRYSAYRKLDRESEAIVFAECWIHARRYFADTLKALPKTL